MAIDLEKLYEDRAEEGAEHYEKKFARQMAIVDKSPLNRVRPHGITAVDKVALGKQLESWSKYVQLCEADGSITQLGTYPNIALDCLAVNFGQSPINVIASVQPIDEVQGLVYFRQFVAQNNRGNVTAGQTLLDTLALPQAFPEGYASDTSVNATVVTDGSPATPATYTNVALAGAGTDFGSPVNPQTISLSATVVNTDGTAVFSGLVPNVSSGAVSGVAQKGSSNTYLSLYGTVNYQNGTVSLTVANVTGSGTNTSVSVTSTFQTVEEANVDLQKAILVLQTKQVRARFFALKSTIGLAESYMLRKRFGISAEEEIAKDLTTSLNLEIMFTAVDLIQSNIPSSPSNIVWPREAPPGVSLFEHLMTLPMAMADSSAQIVSRAGRGEVNCWIAGREACAVLSQLPSFNKLTDDNSYGPSIYGQYNT
jgi:hypothetical protein